MSSLRGRVMMGAMLWTVGLFAGSTIVVTLSHSVFESVSAVHAHGHMAAAVSVLCMIAGFAMVRGALLPFHALRHRLSEVEKGVVSRLNGRYPSEVQPLIDDLNALLIHNEEAVRRATAKAGDLAHGLKTPLAVLSNEAGRLKTNGDPALAAVIAEQVSRMQRQVEYHLAHARAAASGATTGARCSVRDSAEGLSRTLLRLHAERGLVIDVHVPADQVVRAQREDLDEMLGNLLDNACKWAKSHVTIASSTSDAAIVITVDDDGQGLPRSMRDAVLQRGVRADEASPGSGLGLAIVRDLVELYGGSVSLDDSPAGGLRARLVLPDQTSGPDR